MENKLQTVRRALCPMPPSQTPLWPLRCLPKVKSSGCPSAEGWRWGSLLTQFGPLLATVLPPSVLSAGGQSGPA